MRAILDRVQVNMPFRMLVDRYLPLVVKEGINPEIGLDCFALDSFSKETFITVAGKLRDAGLTITIHAPFYDLRPGAIDKKIREVTIERLHQLFELVPYFSPRSIVCHASFDSKYYFTHEDLWLENSMDTWSRFLPLASELDTIMMLENVYEEDPAMLSSLLKSFDDSDRVFACFDTGHYNAFAQTPLDEWLNMLGIYIRQVHLHDNAGSADEHTPVGEGNFPFHRLFEYLRTRGISPIITLEPHTEENLWKTLTNIKAMKLLDYFD